jgi:hypothetical protein
MRRRLFPNCLACFRLLVYVMALTAGAVGSFSWIWDLPKFTRCHSVLRAIVGGWLVNGLVSLRSGQPINILAGDDVALSGTSNQRPNLIKDPELL